MNVAPAAGFGERSREVTEQRVAKSDTEEVLSDAAAQAMAQTPIALLGALMTVPGGRARALGAMRLLARNLPLVLFLVMIAALFWPTKEGEPPVDELDGVRKPNGSDDQMPSALRHRYGTDTLISQAKYEPARELARLVGDRLRSGQTLRHSQGVGAPSPAEMQSVSCREAYPVAGPLSPRPTSIFTTILLSGYSGGVAH